MRPGRSKDEGPDGIDCSAESKCSLRPHPLAAGIKTLVDVSIYRIGLPNPHASALHSAADLGG